MRTKVIEQSGSFSIMSTAHRPEILPLICFLACLWLLGFSNFVFAQLPQYEIDAVVDTANHTISAHQKIVFTNNTNTSTETIYFHIYPHRKYTQKEIEFLYRYAGYFKVEPYPEGFQSGDLEIKQISLTNSTNIDYSIEGENQTILKVILPACLEPNQSIELQIDFSVKIPHSYGRFGWHNNIISLLRWYPILSLYDERGWHNYPFYLYHQPYSSCAAYYMVSLTLPKNQVVAHSGKLKQEIQNEDGTKTLILESDLPIRDFSLGISPDFKLHTLEFAGKRINSFYLPGDERRGQEAASCARDLMQFYGKNFGQYPYSEFNIVPSFLGYGGHESSNLIFIDTRVYKLPGFLRRYFDSLIAHETGHQWFYNLIGSDEYKEAFLDEGLNSYWVLRYLEDKYGRDALVMELPDGVAWLIPNFSFRHSLTARYFYLKKRGLDQPILSSLSSFQEPSSIFALTYGKGAGVLLMLHSLLGEEKFLKIMQRYTSEFRFKNAYLTDFIRLCEEESNQDWDWFFHQWLKTDKSCDYAIGLKDRDIVGQRLGEIQMPIKVEVSFSDGSTLLFDWDGREESKRITIPEGKTVKRAAIDSQERLVLDLNPLNNIWPSDLNVKLVPLYFFAYELPLFLPQDAYSLILGPDFSKGMPGIKASLQKPDDHIFYTSGGFEVGEDKLKTTLGYEMRHLFGKMNSLGFELFDDEAANKQEELNGGKLYLRHELWPAPYGLIDINDHVTFYLLRNREFDNPQNLSGFEDVEQLHYKKRDEAIFGISGLFGRYGPYPDPDYGFRIQPTLEFAGHVLGGKEAFWRASLQWDNYFLILPKQQHKLATRLKIGWGESSDKDLFYLGSDEGLRGFCRKDIKGAHILLGSIEYRIPLVSNLKFYFLDNLVHLEKIQTVLFLDAGYAWFSDFSSADLKKDAGLGFRFHLNLGSLLERIVLRLDIAQAIDEPGADPKVWLGMSHTF